ncbi:Fatty acid synthase [Araneus ventricosus]|uniref:Fatty acid synthase n=1 Tax=Araneus ventricosus TaxID=182803 RepID=A0A4Y2GQK6_ARAVE|nr:Fatty acid synthase [Araneus ventricosus]
MDLSSDHHEYCTGGFNPEDIVISGISGRFPECDNVGELKEALYSKKDLVVFSPKRFEKGMLNVPYDSCGLLKNLDKFDAGFFRVSTLLANNTDPGGRIHLEVIYEALADAGIDASELSGQNIGIFNATSNDDALHISVEDDGSANSNLYRFVQVGRASFAFNFTGPAYSTDSACSSSAVAFWSAVNNIKSGCIEAAVISGCQLNLHPGMTSGYIKYGVATPTGNSRPFDASSDGMIRSEAIAAVFLQKAKSARRAYATVSTVRFYSAGHITEGATVPPLEIEKKLIRDSLKEVKVDSNEIEYMETHGTGTPIGDPIEVNALSEVFFENRSKPLLIGTIKSNLGHTEACSGLCGMIKALLTFENENIPPNIKYHTPNPNCPALLDGRIVVVTEPTPFKGNYIPVTSIGIGGTLVVTMLKKNPIAYNEYGAEKNLPRLVLFPATTEEAVSFLFDYIRNSPKLSNEFFALLNKLSFTDPSLKPFRGYAIFSEAENAFTLIKVNPFHLLWET